MNHKLKKILLKPFDLLYKINPKLELKLLFKLKTGKKLNLENPKTYNEKLQWIKLYDKNELMPICADKYTVRKFVEDNNCREILNDLIWEGYHPEDIPFDTLPNKFVIKVTHGSTFNIICKNKNKLNIEKTKLKLKKWLNEKFLPSYGEWFYGVVKPRIIIEKYLEPSGKQPLFDYKFFCFNGIPKLVYVDTWKQGEHAINVYDIDFNLLPDVKLGYPNDTETYIEKPDNFSEMVQYAKVLSKDFLHVRVDFYNFDGQIYFGELTFTKSAGFGKIEPSSFDEKMGSWIKLPNTTKGELI